MSSNLRISISIWKLNVVHFFTVLLSTEVEVFTVYQKLGEVKKLRDQFTHVGHLTSSVFKTVAHRREQSVGNIEFTAL